MKRPRPYIPLSVRVRVAERQLWRDRGYNAEYDCLRETGSMSERLEWLLAALFNGQSCALDHDPALILRPFVDGFYSPEANDPRYLIYREKADHQQKTTGRKPGAERTATTKGSDIWLKSKFNRLEGRTKQRPKQKIRSRGFQKRTK